MSEIIPQSKSEPILNFRSGEHPNYIFSSIIILFSLLHFQGAFYPSGYNWGFHHLAFFPEFIKLTIPFSMLLLAVPQIQRRICEVFNSLIQTISQASDLKKNIIFAFIIIISVFLFWFVRSRATFLGDGFWLGFRIQLVKTVADIPVEFKHEPLTGLILWKIYKSLTLINIVPSSLYAFQILSILSGIVFMISLWKLANLFTENLHDRILFFLLVFVSGGTQLFFGYVENYALAYAGLIIYILFALQYISGEVKLVVPSIIFAFLYVLYFGTIVFLPSLIYLFYYSLRRGQYKQFLISIVTSPAAVIILLLACGFTYESYSSIMFGGEGHTVPITSVATDRHAYTMFSSKHIIDVLNLYLLLSPFVLIVMIVPFFARFKEINLKDEKLIFVFLLGITGFTMISIFNCDIGMSRDWDLLSIFMLAVIVFAVSIWFKYINDLSLKSILVIIILLTGLNTGPWVALNSDGDKAAARFNVLLENTLWGKFAFKVYEELAIYYRDQGDYQKAEKYYLKFLAVDSTNPRIYGNLADLYQKTGDSAKEIYNYEQAVKYGTEKPEILQNLGIRYGESGRYLEAIKKFNQVLIIDPHRADILNATGTFILRLNKDYKQALTYFLKSIEEDKYYSLAYFNAGLCYEKMDDKNSMKIFYSKFLQLAPDFPGADSLRNKIKF